MGERFLSPGDDEREVTEAGTAGLSSTHAPEWPRGVQGGAQQPMSGSNSPLGDAVKDSEVQLPHLKIFGQKLATTHARLQGPARTRRGSARGRPALCGQAGPRLRL